MKVRRVGIESCVLVDLDTVAVGLPREENQIVFTLPEELVEKILLRVPPDEPAHLVRATIVCKSWRRILSDHAFRRCYRTFHGPPPLLGYICNNDHERSFYSTVQFVPTTTVATAFSPLCVLKLDDSSVRKPWALDCRHGRVLIESRDCNMLIVWDTIAGSQQYLSMPTNKKYPYRYNCTGAVLCAKDRCDHLDCHGGPFLVVMVGMSWLNDNPEEDRQTWARVYSSETGVWSSPTILNDKANQLYKDEYIDDKRPGLLIGDALYYTTVCGRYNIVKYDLYKHELSVMHLPVESQSILMKGNDGGLEVAAMVRTCISMWSWQVDNKGIGGWVRYREMELEDTLLPKGDYIPHLICLAEGTDTVFIDMEEGLFAFHLSSRQVRKIGEAETCYNRPILPYVSFSTPKF